MPDLTPEDRRAQMKTEINSQFNTLVAAGDLPGETPIPVPSPAQAGQPAPVALPAPDGAAPPIAEGQIFKKYKTLEEAERGYYNAVNTLSSVMDENTRLKQQLSQTGGPTSPPGTAASPPSGLSGGRVNPVTRQSIDWSSDAKVIKLAEESGLDPSVVGGLAESIYSQVAPVVDTLQQQLSNAQTVNEAEAYMRRVHPDSFNHLSEVGNFIKADPVAQSAVSALLNADDPRGAMEVAWTLYANRIGLDVQKQMIENSTIAEGQRVVAKAAAALPSSPSTPIHAAVAAANEPSPDVLEALKAKMKTGDQEAAKHYRRMMMGSLLPAQMRTWETQA